MATEALYLSNLPVSSAGSLEVLHRPQLQKYPQVTGTLERINGYSFYDPDCLADAKEEAEGLCHAIVNGLDRQVEVRRENLLDIWQFDRSQKAVVAGNQMGLPMKIFYASPKPIDLQKPMIVPSRTHDWVVVPAARWGGGIPIEALRATTRLEMAGFHFRDHSIACALRHPSMCRIFLREAKKVVRIVGRGAAVGVKASAAFARELLDDPVLLGRFADAKILVEIARWK